MAVQYCMHCGGATSYEAVKPANCRKCGLSFGVAVAPATPMIRPIPGQNEIRTDSLLGKTLEYKKTNFHLNGLTPLGEDEIEIKDDSTMSFSDILKHPESVNLSIEPEPSSKKRKSRTKLSKKALFEEFLAEGQSAPRPQE